MIKGSEANDQDSPRLGHAVQTHPDRHRMQSYHTFTKLFQISRHLRLNGDVTAFCIQLFSFEGRISSCSHLVHSLLGNPTFLKQAQYWFHLDEMKKEIELELTGGEVQAEMEERISSATVGESRVAVTCFLRLATLFIFFPLSVQQSRPRLQLCSRRYVSPPTVAVGPAGPTPWVGRPRTQS